MAAICAYFDRQRKMINQQCYMVSRIGFFNWFRYFFSRNEKLLPLSFNGRSVWVRKGSPDLSVLLSCFGGEFEILRPLYPPDYSGVIVDAGGYIGTATIALRDIFPSAKIIVIEPSEENMHILRKNVAHLENIQIVHGALAGKNVGSIELKDRGTGQWGFTTTASPKDKANAPVLHSTPTFTLASLGVDVNDIGILKLDIEGGEYDLLLNDLETMRKIKAVFVELHDRIIDGCSKLFFDYSKDRELASYGEKYLSIKR